MFKYYDFNVLTKVLDLINNKTVLKEKYRR